MDTFIENVKGAARVTAAVAIIAIFGAIVLVSIAAELGFRWSI